MADSFFIADLAVKLREIRPSGKERPLAPGQNFGLAPAGQQEKFGILSLDFLVTARSMKPALSVDIRFQDAAGSIGQGAD